MIHRGLPLALLTLLLGALDLAGQAESPATLLIQVTDPEGMPASELSVDVLPGLALPFSSARYATGIIALPGPVLAQGTTDKEGRVQIELPHAGWYGVWAKRGDLAVAEQVVAVAPASLAQARHHRLTMRPGSRLTLTLTDDQGEPVAQAVAHAVDPLAVPPHRGFCGTGEQGPDLDDFISNDAGLVQVFVPDSGPAGRREQVWVAISRLGGEPVFAEISVKEHDNRHALAMGAVTTLSVRTEEVEGQEAGAWITLQTNRSVRESPGLPALHAHPWGQLLRTASHSARAHASAVHAATFVCAPGSVVEAQIDRSGGPPRGQTIP
ncbi:MAG: hypothetical protein KDB53_20645, partial [Planctomycetes bacterium]|nr:hypothetical protein [Planctomycetota bacterium]